jgi:adenylosuccinate synthase
LIVDYHKHLDAARESRKAGKIGTTKRGIGPAYEDRAARRGLRVSDLFHEKLFEERLKANLEEKNFLLEKYYGVPPVNMEEFQSKYREIGQKLKPFVKDVSRLMADSIAEGKKILYEGAQGVLLDMDYGTYPYVTSSNCVAGNAAAGSGVGPDSLQYILGITKAYCTRVGAGPFPSELYDFDNPAKQDPVGIRLAEVGKEFGSVTGRPRRTGWLDAAALKRSIQINGLSGLCITKLDVLDGFETIRLCVGYTLDGQKLDVLPRGAEAVAHCEPIYEDFPGWKGTTFGIREWDKLPIEAQKFLRRIEEVAGKPIAMVSTGPERDETILLQHPFKG